MSAGAHGGLEVDGIEAGYGSAQVLFGPSLRVGEGEVVALMGRNGMGKTTLVHAVAGLVPLRGGRVRFAGREVGGLPSHRVARLGLGLVPEGRRVFASLSVEENLLATARPGRWTLAGVHELFPRLAERRASGAGLLSGGEQQMLAIARALMTNPRLLVLDEATEGLAPLVREEIWLCLARLKAEGEAILVVDKHLDRLRLLADRIVVLERGRVAWEGAPRALDTDRARVEAHLHV